MSITDILADIRKLNEIEERNAETNFEILSKNLQLLKHPDYSNFVSELLSNGEDPKNKEMLELFAKFGANISISQFPFTQLTNRLPDNPGYTVKFGWYNGKQLKGPEWMWCLPASRIFCRSNIEVRKDFLILLLKHGLDISSSGYMFANIFQQFIRYFVEKDDNDVEEIVEILINAGASVDDGLSNAVIRTESIKLVSALIARGADVNKPTKLGSLALCLAARRDKIDFVNLLLVNGAKINAKDELGKTALHRACLRRHENIIRLLISKGANISSLDKDNKTPVSYLLFRANEEDKQCLIVMIKEFAKLKFNNLPVLQEDLDLIKTHSKSREDFDSCEKELQQMSTKFYSSYSYIYVLNVRVGKNFKKLVSLTKNTEFVASFEKKLSFPLYENDLLRIFEEAIQARNESKVVISRLYLAFGNFFPEIIIRKLEENLTLEDIPLE